MKNLGARAPGCLGRNVGRICPREAPLFQSSLIGRGRKQCAFVAGPLWTFAGPESSGPPTPHPVAVCDLRGLPPALRRGGGFQVLLAARPKSLLIARMQAVADG